MESDEERKLRIKIHEDWMGFRRGYNNVKEGHRPKITHEEVQEFVYRMVKENLTKHNNDLKKVCPKCQGEGKSHKVQQEGISTHKCPMCNGMGKPIIKP